MTSKVTIECETLERATRRGFDSLHPLIPSCCQNTLFPSERNAQPPSMGRDRGGFFTFF